MRYLSTNTETYTKDTQCTYMCNVWQQCDNKPLQSSTEPRRLAANDSCTTASQYNLNPQQTLTTTMICRHFKVNTKTAVFFIRRSTRSCHQTAYYWTSRLPCRRRLHMERPTGRRHLQKTTQTASVPTFISWPSLINYCYSVWSLW